MENLCEKYIGMMFDYLDGELNDSDRADFDGHIAVCQDCSEELRRRKKTLEYIADSAYKPSHDLAAAVTGIINITRKRNKFMQIGSAVAACIVMAAFITVYSVINRSNSSVLDSAEENVSYDISAETNTLDVDSAEENSIMETQMQSSADDTNSEDTDENAESNGDTEEYFYSFGMPATAADTGAATTENSADVSAGNGNETEAGDETETETRANSKSLLTAQPDTDTDDAAMIDFYTNIYAPDYKGHICCVVLLNTSPPDSFNLYQIGENFNSYIAEYTDELYDSVVDIYQNDSETHRLYYIDPTTDGAENFILYIKIK